MINNEHIQALKAAAESQIGILENIAGYEPGDIDGDDVELRFETEDGFDTGCNVSIVEQCQSAADVIRSLLSERDDDKALIAKLQTANAAQDDHINQQADLIESLEKTNHGLGKRLCAVEARTLTVDLRKHLVNEVMIISQMDRQYSEGWCSANDWAILKIREACAAAGITLKVGGE
ncbi:hypothetical protein [Phytobacter sp. V91]|uniref:hypothetical protein n=1 Tax=Phytobacter sp. V91 TaxID=3369425 RepID=UPI003F62F856